MSLSQHIQINPNPSANFEYSIEFQNNCNIGVKFNNQSESADSYFGILMMEKYQNFRTL